MKKCKESQCLTQLSENTPDFCPEHSTPNTQTILRDHICRFNDFPQECECFKAGFSSHHSDLKQRVEEILEENRKETLWGSRADNEVMNVSIDEYIKAVKTDLLILLETNEKEK